MTELSLPWDGTTTGDAGTYTGAEWQQLQKMELGLGAAHDYNSGVFWGSDTLDLSKRGLDVEAQSPVAAAVNVRPGSALVNGALYINDAVKALSIAANASGNPRIDSIIVRKDVAAQTCRAVVKQGTPAASPVAPTLTQSAAVWETPLADITVANGFATLAQSTIQPTAAPRNESDGLCHIVLNNSGGTLKTGDVVIWDTSAQRAVTTTTTQNNALVAGVWVGTTPNGSYGRVLYRGIGLVRTIAAVARGDMLSTSATAKQARVPASSVGPFPAFFAFVLETTGAAGLALASIDCPNEVQSSPLGATGTPSTNSATFVTALTVGPYVSRGYPIFASVNLIYNDTGVLNPAFNTLSVSIFEDGVNKADTWANMAGTRIWRQGCNDMRRSIVGTLRRTSIIAPGTSVTFTLRWAVSGGTVSAEDASFIIYELPVR